MLSEEYDGAAERECVTALVVHDAVLGRLAGRAGRDPFQSRYSNAVYRLCEEFYAKHRRAPGREIETLFRAWARGNGDGDTVKLVGSYLSSLSAQYEREGSRDQAVLLAAVESHLNSVRVQRLEDALREARTRGQTDAAVAAAQEFAPLRLAAAPFTDVLADADAQRAAYDSRRRVLVRYPGAAGDFFGEELSADSFVAFAAPPKGGKSQWLLDVGWRAMLQGHTVGYFQVGDMSKDQVMRRFLLRAARRPAGHKFFRWPVRLTVPEGRHALAQVEFEDRTYDTPMTLAEAQAAFARVRDRARGRLLLSRHNTKSVTVNDLRAVLSDWAKEGLAPKVVVVDYPENLAAVNGKSDAHQQVDDTWGRLKMLSEELGCLLVAASQTNKEGFKTRWVLTRANFRGSLMTIAHVSAYIGINQTDEESLDQVQRLNYAVCRGERFSESKCLYCATSLDISDPCVLSSF